MSASPPPMPQQPLVDIEEPHHNDVLCGRGVTTNRHPGNETFRSIVSLNKEVYVSSSKKEKTAISKNIVQAVRDLVPPGRFLEKNIHTGLWSDIGEKKALEKTSQALRDGSVGLRKQLSADLGNPEFLHAVFDIEEEQAMISEVSEENKRKEEEAKARRAKAAKAKIAKKKAQKAKVSSSYMAIGKHQMRYQRSLEAPPSPSTRTEPPYHHGVPGRAYSVSSVTSAPAKPWRVCPGPPPDYGSSYEHPPPPNTRPPPPRPAGIVRSHSYDPSYSSPMRRPPPPISDSSGSVSAHSPPRRDLHRYRPVPPPPPALHPPHRAAPYSPVPPPPGPPPPPFSVPSSPAPPPPRRHYSPHPGSPVRSMAHRSEYRAGPPSPERPMFRQHRPQYNGPGHLVSPDPQPSSSCPPPSYRAPYPHTPPPRSVSYYAHRPSPVPSRGHPPPPTRSDSGLDVPSLERRSGASGVPVSERLTLAPRTGPPTSYESRTQVIIHRTTSYDSYRSTGHYYPSEHGAGHPYAEYETGQVEQHPQSYHDEHVPSYRDERAPSYCDEHLPGYHDAHKPNYQEKQTTDYHDENASNSHEKDAASSTHGSVNVREKEESPSPPPSSAVVDSLEAVSPSMTQSNPTKTESDAMIVTPKSNEEESAGDDDNPDRFIGLSLSPTPFDVEDF